MLEQPDKWNHSKLSDSDLDLTHLHSLKEQQKEISLKLAVRLINVVSGFDSRGTRSKGSLSAQARLCLEGAIASGMPTKCHRRGVPQDSFPYCREYPGTALSVLLEAAKCLELASPWLREESSFATLVLKKWHKGYTAAASKLLTSEDNFDGGTRSIMVFRVLECSPKASWCSG